jgi:hypothetical protein
MAQTSSNVIASKSHKVNITISEGCSFTTASDIYKISTASTSMGALDPYDLITISGTSLNNSTFTVKSVALDGLSVIVEEVVAIESADGSTDTVIDHVGFVSAKQKGDGFYSKVDGVHTVAYKVANDLVGDIKMQGTLASTPTENDWFDISGTTFTADQSTLITSRNFTGNFVYVRANATSVTAGTISSIQLNS